MPLHVACRAFRCRDIRTRGHAEDALEGSGQVALVGEPAPVRGTRHGDSLKNEVSRVVRAKLCEVRVWRHPNGIPKAANEMERAGVTDAGQLRELDRLRI